MPHLSLPALLRRGVVAILAMALAGCPRPTREEGAGPLPSVSPPAGNVATRLGAGDVFEVRVFQEAELTGVYRVGAEGTIDFPFCGRLNVLGQTSAEVATRLRDCLAAGYLRDPQVTVVAREYNSKKVFVLGEVQKPGTYPFEDDMSIIQAVAVAGGLTAKADANKVRVTRAAGGEGEKKFEVPVEDVGTGRAPNFFLQPGDIVFVPESIF